MKTITFFCILFLVSGSIFAQNCFWAKSAGGTDSERGKNIATDPNGNVYVIGEFESNEIVFGNDTLDGGLGNDLIDGGVLVNINLSGDTGIVRFVPNLRH